MKKNNLKTKSSKRILYLPDFLKKELIQHKSMNAELGSDFVCANIFIGTVPVLPDNLSHKFHDFMKNEFDINIRLHDLRHSLNQLMYESGVDNTTRAKVLGHSNTKMTDTIYTHNSFNLNEDALQSVSKKITNT